MFCGHDLLVLPLRTGISQERPPPDSGGSRFLTPPTSCNRRAVGGTAGHSLGKPWPQVCKTAERDVFKQRARLCSSTSVPSWLEGLVTHFSWKTMHSSLFSREPYGRPVWLTKGPLWGRTRGWWEAGWGGTSISTPTPPTPPSFRRQPRAHRALTPAADPGWGVQGSGLPRPLGAGEAGVAQAPRGSQPQGPRCGRGVKSFPPSGLDVGPRGDREP